MTTRARFKRRLTEVYVYPEICRHQDAIADVPAYMRFQESEPPPTTSFMFYFHIPFCEAFCWFCNYYKEVLRPDGYEARRKLFDAFKKEILSYANRRYFRTRTVRAVQFGGGTPSAVEPKFIAELLDTIRQNFNCQLEMISMEGNVTSLQSDEKLQVLKDAGVQRVSFGVQTLNESIRRKLRLKATIPDVFAAVDALNRVGIGYSHDLMFNLPDQTLDDMLQDMDIVEHQIKPAYIDCYNLNIMPNTMFGNALDRGCSAELPSTEKEVTMMRELIRTAKARGLHQVASNVFSPSKRRPVLTLEMALDGSDVVGIGPSARSYVQGRGYKNVAALQPYIDRVNECGWGAIAGNVATPEEIEERKLVMLGNLTLLKKSEVVNWPRFAAAVDFLLEEGYAVDDGEYLRLTDEGKVWPGNISELFFSDRDRLRRNNAMLSAFREKENPYNQDHMGISAAVYRKENPVR